MSKGSTPPWFWVFMFILIVVIIGLLSLAYGPETP